MAKGDLTYKQLPIKFFEIGDTYDITKLPYNNLVVWITVFGEVDVEKDCIFISNLLKTSKYFYHKTVWDEIKYVASSGKKESLPLVFGNI